MTTSAAQTESGQPISSPVFLVSWASLESGWSLLSSPDRASDIPTMVSALRRLQPTLSPDKLLVQILSATAWLTSDATSLAESGEASMT
ncbi:MAG: hypothetical protein Q7T61_19415 [Caulobacter sp.]|nr:hypothetical protein [Caulobacter sp.]